MSEHIVALRNPVAFQAEALNWRLAELERGCEHFAEFTLVDTAPNQDESRARLYETVRPGSKLIVASGDGTLSQTANNIVNDHPGKPAHIANTKVVAFGTGNKNDVAVMLNGEYSTDPLHMIRYGKPVEVPMLEAVFSQDGEVVEDQLVLYSLGFGTIGLGARIANNKAFRDAQHGRKAFARRVSEYGLAFDAYRQSEVQPFVVDGKAHPALSVFFSNGDRMAGDWRLPASLPEIEFYMGFVRSKKLLPTIRDGIGLLTNSLPDGELRRDTVRLDILQPTIGQVDGEDRDVSPGTVHVGLGPSLTFISTRYQPSKTPGVPIGEQPS